MAKRGRFTGDATQQTMKDAVLEAMDEDFPWAGALGDSVKNYIFTLAEAANAPPEFVLLGLLVSTSAAMGPDASVGPLPGYQEPLNLFALCIGPSGSGKTQTLQLAVQQPIKHLFGSWTQQVLVDDFTREGFRRQLIANSGRVMLASDEIAGLLENLDKKSSEASADRHLFCRLFDAASWTRTTGKSCNRQCVLWPAHIFCTCV